MPFESSFFSRHLAITPPGSATLRATKKRYFQSLFVYSSLLSRKMVECASETKTAGDLKISTNAKGRGWINEKIFRNL